MRWSRSVIAIVLIVVAGGLVWLLAAVGLFGGGRPNVILISLDTCRADYISCYGRYPGITPNIDTLAGEGFLFKNVVSPVPLTLPAHSSMLTGLIPPCHGVHDNINYRLSDENVTLAERLRQQGYKTAAIVGAFVLDAQFGLGQGFDSYDDDLGTEHRFMGGYAERPGGEVTRLAKEWLAKNQDEPFFLFLHYFDPHHPYNPPEPYASGAYADNPYAGEVAYTDHCVGQVIGELKRLRLYDSSLVIVVGDHGESLWEHGESKHGYFIYHSTTKVPLIIKPSGPTAHKVINDTVGIVDIVPTVLSHVGVPDPPHGQGIDLTPLMFGETTGSEPRFYYSESLTPTRYGCNSLLGTETRRWKYIQTTHPELYDLPNDPSEKNNLAADNPKITETFRDQLQETLELCLYAKPDDSTVALGPDSLDKLQGLGYAGKSVEEIFESDASRPDPKDFIDLFTKVEALDYYVDTRDFGEARRVAEEILAVRPDIAHIYAKLGQMAIQTGNFGEAFDRYTKALELDPTKIEWHINLGILLSKRGEHDKAIEEFHVALRLAQPSEEGALSLDRVMVGREFSDPLVSRAHYNMGNTLMKQGQVNEAINEYREAARFDPQDPNVHYKLGLALKALGKYDEARAALREALRLDANHSAAQQALDGMPGG